MYVRLYPSRSTGKLGFRVFENWTLWRIFLPGMEEVTEDWRKLDSGELLNLYSLPVISE
jgi:hypothetical protein